MSEQPSPEQTTPESAPADRSRRARWFVVGMLVLLGGWFVVVQIISRGGTPIEWTYNYDQAQQLARQTGHRIFLVLQEPNCPVMAGNERNLFSQRNVKERLAKMVCCRLYVRPNDPLLIKLALRDEDGRPLLDLHEHPVMVVLAPGRDKPIDRTLEGTVDFQQFRTYVNPGDDPAPEQREQP